MRKIISILLATAILSSTIPSITNLATDNKSTFTSGEVDNITKFIDKDDNAADKARAVNYDTPTMRVNNNYMDIEDSSHNITASTIARGYSVGDVLESEEIETIEEKTPCYGEYQILSNEGEIMPLAADKKDQYESNNSFAAATKLNSQPSGRPVSFTVTRYATLHRESWLWGLIKRGVDEDYYRFDLFGNASVTISLDNIPSGCNYDIKLYQYDNERYAGEQDITLLRSSTKTGNASETITKTLVAGTYYVWVYSPNDTSNATSNYKLRVKATYSAKNESIAQLRFNKGAKAAMWVSDYNPCGIKPYSYSDKVEVGYMSAGTISAAKFQNPYVRYFTSGQPIEHAVLDVWDKDLRIQMRNLLTELYNEVSSDLKDKKLTKMKWELLDSGSASAGTVGRLAITLFNGSTQIFKRIFKFAPIVVSLLKYIFAPSDEVITTKENLLDYIRDVRTALEANKDTGNEVVRIPFTYFYSKTNAIGITHISHYFDFTQSPQDKYLYDSDTIPSWNTNSIVHGTIYGIIDADDITNAINHGKNSLPDINTSTVKTISLNSSMPGNINVGEYHWYKFTAPSTGMYSFYTENSFDTYGELFNSVVPARSITGRLTYNNNGNGNLNFKIDYQLNAGQIVYLRVRGNGWTKTGNYTLRIAKLS